MTTVSKHKHPVAPNLVNREFRPECPNMVWASDPTYVMTDEGWLYLCVVIGLSRTVIGWAPSRSLRAGIVLQAL